jgi:hypothetical protein
MPGLWERNRTSNVIFLEITDREKLGDDLLSTASESPQRLPSKLPTLRRVGEVGQVLVITPLRVSSSRRRWVRIR